jgi:hypothetical protein
MVAQSYLFCFIFEAKNYYKKDSLQKFFIIKKVTFEERLNVNISKATS